MQHPVGAEGTPRELTVILDEFVEVEQVLVETEHVGDRRCQRVARTLADVVSDGIDAELAAPRRESDCSRAARDRQRRFQHPRLEVEPVQAIPDE